MTTELPDQISPSATHHSPLTTHHLVAGLVLLGLFFGQGLHFIGSNSQTFDEAVHLTAGYSYLATGDFRLNPEDPPLLKQLCALPLFLWYHLPFEPSPDFWQEAKEGEDRGQWWISRDFLYGSPVPAERLLALGRVPNLGLGTCLIALIGWWSYRLWGPGAALLGMSLAAFEPNLVAHSSVITTDLSITLFGFLTLYLIWEYTVSPSHGRLAAIGVALGLAVVSKFSCILFLTIAILSLVIHLALGGSFALPRATRTDEVLGLRIRLQNAVGPLLRVISLAILMILPFYFFQGFSSWTYGLRTQMNQQTTGKEAFFFGEYSDGGWWSYFVVSLFIKTPIGSLVVILASVLFYRKGSRLGRREVAFLLAPLALYLLALTRLRLNIGLRYALPVYPFLFVLASRLATIAFGRAWAALLLLGIPVACTALSSLRVAPHQLAYFNELVGGPEKGYRYLSNSNIDWGQDLGAVKEYMDREGLPMIYLSYYGTAPPAYYGIRHQQLPGYGQLGKPSTEIVPACSPRTVLAISVVNVQSVHFADKDLFRWLYERTPIAKIGYSIFVYDLTGDAEAHRHLAEVYWKAGLPNLARAELRKVLTLDPTDPAAAWQLPLLHERLAAESHQPTIEIQ